MWMAPAVSGLAGLFDSGDLVQALMAADSQLAFVETVEDAEARTYSFESPGLHVPHPSIPSGSSLRHAPQDDWRAGGGCTNESAP